MVRNGERRRSKVRRALFAAKKKASEKLVWNWRSILVHAWSIRLNFLAAILTGVEVILPLYSDSVPRGTFAALSFVVVILAMWARIVVQKNVNQ